MMNYYCIKQEPHESLQDYWNQLTAYKNVCEKLGSKVSACDTGASNMLKRINIVNPTEQQRLDA